MSKRRKKLPGHYCWACDRRRSNERFSGKNRRRHVCRDCAKLGPDELRRRSTERHLDRLVQIDGIIPRRKRRAFEGYLNHRDPRVRAVAEAYQRRDAEARERRRLEWEQIRRDEELYLLRSEALAEPELEVVGCDPILPPWLVEDDDDIPF